MGCAHRMRQRVVPASTELIQLLVPAPFYEDRDRKDLTAYVLGVVQRNAKVAGQQEPRAIKIISASLGENQAVAGAGDKLANIDYEIVS